MNFKLFTLLLIFFISCARNVDPDELKPVNLKIDPEAGSITSRSISLIWTKCTSSKFNRYEVHLSKISNFTISSRTFYEMLDDRYDTTTFVTDLDPSTNYYFKVRVVSRDGKMADSNEVSAKTLAE